MLSPLYEMHNVQKIHIWLLRQDGSELHRLTDDREDTMIMGESPDAMHLVIKRSEASHLLYSLEQGTVTDLDILIEDTIVVGGFK